MSTGGCGISLDRDSVSKEFQSRIVLEKNKIPVYMRTSGQSGKVEFRIRITSLHMKVGPNHHQCL